MEAMFSVVLWTSLRLLIMLIIGCCLVNCWRAQMITGCGYVLVCSGVAMGWTGVDMSTTLLPEVIPEIDANPMTFLEGEWGRG